MVQKLINDTEENKFYSVWLQLFQQTMTDLQDYFNLVYESHLLGGLIFDGRTFVYFVCNIWFKCDDIR